MKLPKWRDREKLPAVFEDSLIPLLIRLGLYQPLLGGNLECSFCSTTLTLANLQGLYQREGGIVLFCDKPGCILSGLHNARSTKNLEKVV